MSIASPLINLPFKCQKLETLQFRVDKMPVIDNKGLQAMLRLHNAMNGKPLWTKDNTITSQARILIEHLSRADSKGLHISTYTGNIDWIKYLQGTNDLSELICHDLVFSAVLMRYISHARMGQLNPRKFNLTYSKQKSKKLDLAKLIIQLAQSNTPIALLDSLEPNSHPYRVLVRLLQQYQGGMKDKQQYGSLVIKKVLSPGKSYPELKYLASRLESFGVLPQGYNATLIDTVYNPTLVQAVKDFQRRYGLRVDGIIGSNTLSALNGSIEDKLIVAIERWRWLPEQLGNRPIFVNIPEYKLYALEPDNTMGWYKTALSMRVIVGADRYNTPSIYSSIRSIELMPYWNVPISILRNEMFKRIKGYGISSHYEIVNSSGVPLQFSKKLLSGLWNGTIQLRQKPSRNNVLGFAKFRFPNRDSIYLHGTPNKRLFHRGNRALSHGCIRLQDEVHFATYLLKDQGWNEQRIRKVIRRGENYVVRLKKPVAIYLTYNTTLVNSNGSLSFVYDVYKHDAEILRALQRIAQEGVTKLI
ncbi:hypothetical protein TI03_00915 [Achromatium sp. WMS1]|nr:hypothetical protein TI03_00915 [Achromatium sp. WMS1]